MVNKNYVERKISLSKEVLNILERKDKERETEIKRIKSLKIPEWERKLMLKAVKSNTFGW